MNQIIGKHYERGALIGRGGMGLVYQGIDQSNQRPVAIKQLRSDVLSADSQLMERFIREGEILRKLNHPNIVKLLDAFQDGDQYYLIMEYVNGGNLDDIIQQHHPLPIQQILTIAIELADALTRAHYLNVIHRDLKPANILITADDVLKLSDFGVAHIPTSPRITELGMAVGTLDYLSPEALNGEGMDNRADIWAFGMTLFELLTAQNPFQTGTVSSTVMAILNQPTPDLEQLRPDAPTAFVDLIYRMLEKDRHQRIRSVRQVGLELEAIMQGDTPVIPTFEPLPEPSPAYQLPIDATPFIGREAEIDELTRWLLDDHGRVLTLIATGGMGKTRLALAVAHHLSQNHPAHFPDGIYFVSLAGLSDVDQIIPAICDTLNYQGQGITPLGQQLARYLSHKKLLLILDNFEHLLDGASLLPDILQSAPQLKVIATSRERLGLSDEHLFHVMSFPTKPWRTVAEAQQFAVVQLFIQYAKRIQRTFEINDENLGAITHICQTVQGMPLAIVIATGWLSVMSLDEVAEEITQSMDFLATDLRDIPERQRSIRAIFEQTWQLLSAQEQDVVQKLSVFRGGFMRDAAQVISGASLGTLASLVNKALLSRNQTSGRFDMHELLRQYAREQLEASGEADAIYDAHSAYFAGVLHRYQPIIQPHALPNGILAHTIATSYDAPSPVHIIPYTEPLTEREIEILQYVADGYSNRDIAMELVISISTVKTHLNRVFSKLGVKSRTQAILQAQNNGLIR